MEKRTYEKPVAEILEFEIPESIMEGTIGGLPGFSNDDAEEW